MSKSFCEQIKALYQLILHRDVDPSGLKTYTGLLRQGKLTIADIAQILRESDEFEDLVFQKHVPYRFEYATVDRLSVDTAAHGKKNAGKNSGLVVATIVSKDSISLARVTANSFLKYHPDIPFVTLLADEVSHCFAPADEPFQTIEIKDIGIPDLQSFCFRYTKQEASYAATPFFIEYLLERGYSHVLFLKQETLVVNNLDGIFAALSQASLVLTPHLLGPQLGLNNIQGELNVLRAGIFNGGVLGFSNTIEAYSFLHWWQEHTYLNCFHLVEDGLHYEQRWLDFAPSLVSDVHIIRDPGVNVGHWNMQVRNISEDDGVLMAQGVVCRIIRFSGYDPDRPGQVTRYDDSLLINNIGFAEFIFTRYQEQLEIAAYHATKHWPYAYDYFDNGELIPAIVRRIYHQLGAKGARFTNPSCNTGQSTSFYSWLIQDSGNVSGTSLPNLYVGIYELLPELQLRYPDMKSSATDFKQWCTANLASEFAIPGEMLMKLERG